MSNSKCDKGVNLLEHRNNITQGDCDNQLNAKVGKKEIIAKIGDNNFTHDNATVDTKPNNSHSRQSSDSCYTSSAVSEINENRIHRREMVVEELGNCTQGNIVGLHRKMVSSNSYNVMYDSFFCIFNYL